MSERENTLPAFSTVCHVSDAVVGREIARRSVPPHSLSFYVRLGGFSSTTTTETLSDDPDRIARFASE